MKDKKNRYFAWGLTLYILGIVGVIVFINVLVIYQIQDAWLIPIIIMGLVSLAEIIIGSIIVNKTLE